MARAVDTRLSSGLVVSDGDNPLTVGVAGALISQAVDPGLLAGPIAADWQIVNDGTVGSVGPYGIAVFSGGTIENGPDSDEALVYGAIAGIVATAASTTIDNDGSITGKGLAAIWLQAGGSITNGSDNDASATLSGVITAVYAAGPLTLDNSGTLNGTAGFGAIVLDGGGISNGNAATTVATITGAIDGIAEFGGFGTLANSGTVLGVGAFGAAYIQGASIDNAGLLQGVWTGAYVTGGAASVLNSGQIISTGLGGLWIDGAGSLDNAATGSIVGQTSGVFWTTGTAALTNLGTISATAAFGAILVEGGTLANGDAGTPGALIDGPIDGVAAFDGALNATNLGAIVGTQAFGIIAASGGTIVNGAAGSITGGAVGVVLFGPPGSITNSGTLAGTAGSGAWLAGGGTVANVGLISGGATALLVQGAGATVSNTGTISGVVGLQATGESAGAVDLVVNAGLIAGSGGTALQFFDPGATLRLQSGAAFTGAVIGAGDSTLELGTGGGDLAGLGSRFTGFATVLVDAATAWRLDGSNALTVGSSLGLNGALTLAPGAALDLEGFAGSTGLIDLGGAGSQVLVLGASSIGGRGGAFAPSIGDVGAGDAIVLGGIAASGTATAQVAAGAGGASVVTVRDSGGAVIATLSSVSFAASGLGFTASTASGGITLLAGPQTVTSPLPAVPTLAAALADDTGSSSADGISTDAAVSAHVAAPGGLASLTATLNGGSAVLDLTSAVQSGGAVSLTAAQVASLASGGALAAGGHLLRLQATDALGQVGTFALAFTIDGGASFALTPSGPYATGTGTLTLSGVASDPQAGVTALTASLDGGAPVDVALAAGGSFSINTATLFGAASAVGTHDVKLAATTAGGASGIIDVPFTVGTGMPTVTLATPSAGGTLAQGAVLSGTATPGLGTLVGLSYAFDGGTAMPVAFDAATGAFTAALDLSHLNVGTHSLAVTALDSSGGMTVLREAETLAALVPLTVVSLTPANGAGDVGTTYHPVLTFSRAVDPATLTSSSFFATDSSGAKLAATVVASADGTSATMFFTSAMPGASTVTLHVVGSLIKGASDGAALDAADMGTAGSARTSMLTTVSTAGVPNTVLQGIIADPGADLTPGTADDVVNNPDGTKTYKLGIAGVTVSVLGTSIATTTDATGHYTLTNIPVGDVKIEIDGRTATNAPAGYYFPDMTMDTTIQPGVTQTLMGSMGGSAQAAANAALQGAYLPRVQTSILTAVSATAPTMVKAPVTSSGSLTAGQLSQLTLTVAPGSVVDANGNAVSGAQVGISPVPSSIVQDMLPPGLASHTFDITIQAPGAAAFTAGATLTMPNVFGLAPGEKTFVLSFDHTTGRLVIDGTATVSADGQTVTTDPGAGVTAPGWHGMTPATWLSRLQPVISLAKNPCIVAGGKAAYDTYKVGKDSVSVFKNTTAAIEGAVDGAELGAIVGGPVGAVLGGLLGGAIGYYVAQKDTTYVDALKDAAKSSAATIAKDEIAKKSGQDIAKDVITGFADPINKIIETQNPLIGVAEAPVDLFKDWKGLLDDSTKLGQDGGALATWLSQNGGVGIGKASASDSSILPTASSLTAAVASALGLENLSTGDTQALADLIGDFESNESTLPQVLVQFARATKDITTIAVLSKQSTLSDTDVQTLLTAVADLNANLSGLDLGPNVAGTIQLQVTTSTNTLVGNVLAATPQTTLSTQLSDATYYRIDIAGQSIFGKGSTLADLQVLLAPNAFATLYLFDAKNLTYGTLSFVTGNSGQTGQLQSILMNADTSVDTTGDGVPDDAKYVLNITGSATSTLVSEIQDIVALQQGVSDAQSLENVTGVETSEALRGTADAVVVMSLSKVTSNQVAFVATGTYGLALVDVSSPLSPSILSQLALTGTSTDVAVDSSLSIAIIASGSGGVNLIDVSTPTAPKIIATLAISATAVQAYDGVAYVNDGSAVDAIDIATGYVLQRLTLGGSTVVSLAQDGGVLYALDSGRTLHVLTISTAGLSQSGTVTLSVGGTGRIYAAGGVVYVPADNGFAGGYATVDVSKPTAPKLITNPTATNIGGDAIALNGSGLGVVVGAPGNTTNAIDLVNTSDPTNTGAFITRFTLPSKPLDVAIGGGVAFVADGTSGLQVVNYKAIDTSGVGPTITVLSEPGGNAPGTAAISLTEGSAATFQVAIADPGQVRDVAVLENGNVVLDDVSYPYQLTTTLPSIAANGSNTLTLAIRATDTAGNIATSTPVTVTLQKDMVAPTLVSENIAPSQVYGQTFRAFSFNFSKALDPSTVTAANFELIGPGGVAVAPQSVQILGLGRAVQVTYAPLALGSYQYVLNAPAITDGAGNALGAAPQTTSFLVQPFSTNWVGAHGGAWSTGSNWSAGTAPVSTDDAYINLPVGEQVTYSSGTLDLPELVFAGGGTLLVSGGSLTIASNLNIQGALAVSGGVIDPDASVGSLLHSGGTITGAGTLTVTGAATLTNSLQTGTGLTVLQGASTLNGSLTIGGARTVENKGTLTESGSVYIGDSASSTAVLQNDAGAVFDIVGIYGFGSYAATNSSFMNAGLFEKTAGAGTGYVYSKFTNTGTVLVSSGEISFQTSNTYTGTIAGTGTIGLNGPVNTIASSLVLNVATTNVSGTLALSADFAYAGVLLAANSTLALGGHTLTLSQSPDTVTGVTASGTGTVLTSNTIAVAVDNMTLAGAAVLENKGTETLAGNLNIGDSATSTAKLQNDAGAVFDITNNVGLYGGVPSNRPNVSIVNAGLFEKTAGTGAAYVYAPITNTGTVLVSSGEISFQTSNTYTGTIAGTGTIGLNGPVNTIASSLVLNVATTNVSGTLALSADFAYAGVLLAANSTLALGGHTLTLSQSPDTVTGVTASGTGTVLTSNTIAVAVDNMTLAGATVLENKGTETLAGNLNIGDSATSTAKLQNDAGAVFDITNNIGIYGGVPSNRPNVSIVNAGLFEKAGGTGTAYVYAPITNTGTVLVSSGEISFQTSNTYTGTISGSGTIGLNGPVNTIASSLVLNVATTNVSGTLALSADFAYAGVLLAANSTLALGGHTLTLSQSPDTVTGVTASGTGTVLTSNTIAVAVDNMTLAGATVLENKGTETLAGNLNIGDSATSTAKLQNDAGAVFDITNNIGIYGGVPSNRPNVSIVNAGLLEKTAGTSAAYVYAPITNTGTVLVSSGEISFQTSNTYTGTISGSGTIGLNGPVNTIASSLVLNVATTNVSGTLALSADFAYAGVLLAANSTLALGGHTLTLSQSPDTVTGVTASGTGTVLTSNTIAVAVDNMTLAGAAVLENKGTETLAGNLNIGDSATSTAKLQNDAGAVFDITNNIGIYGGVPSNRPNVSIVNAGLLEKTAGTSAAYVYAPITNTGTVLVSSGEISFQDTVTGTGVFNLGPSVILDFAKHVDTGATMKFVGTGSTLEIDGGSSFAGGVSGLTQSDEIDVTSVAFSSNPGLTLTTNSGGVLATLTAASNSAAIELLGSYLATDLRLANDGHGGTAILHT